MIKRLFTLLAFLPMVLSCSASDSTKVAGILAPEEHHRQVAMLTAQILKSNHYAKPSFNDNLSSHVWAEFLKNVDFAKAFLLKEDVDKFAKYRYELDDMLQQGDNQAAFELYNTYVNRSLDRIQKVYTLLKDSFNYDRIDSFQVNREKAPWFANMSEADAYWKRRIMYECLTYQVNGTDWKSASGNIEKRYKNYEKQLRKIKSQDVFDVWMNSFTEVVDPHTAYMSPRRSEDFNINMSLSLEGIGATLQTDNDYTVIRDLVKGGPAEKSKQLKIGDRIVAVGQGDEGDFLDVVGWRIDDVIQHIRGKRNTIVRLSILPADETNASKTRVVKLVRDKIKLEEQAAKGEVQEYKKGRKTYKLGVIKLPTFYLDFAGMNRGDKDYKSTTSDVRKLLDGFKNQKVDAVIVDLRNNGGGSLLEAVQMTGLFIDKGPVVQVRNTDGSTSVEADQTSGASWTGPLAVMVNRFSASASEIFAAAIQDYRRGIVIGENTFGKGTVQNLLNMDQFVSNGKGGQLKLTIAKFYRIDGGSTQLKGVKPDVEIAGMFDESIYGEAASPYALKWDKIQAAAYSTTRDVDASMVQELIKGQKERASKDLAYVNLQEEIDESRANRNKAFVTLNKGLMKEENEAAEARKKARKARIGEVEPAEKEKKEKKTDEDAEEVPLYEKSDLYFKASRDIVVELLQKKS